MDGARVMRLWMVLHLATVAIVWAAVVIGERCPHPSMERQSGKGW